MVSSKNEGRRVARSKERSSCRFSLFNVNDVSQRDVKITKCQQYIGSVNGVLDRIIEGRAGEREETGRATARKVDTRLPRGEVGPLRQLNPTAKLTARRAAASFAPGRRSRKKREAHLM